MRNFRELKIWIKGMEIAQMVNTILHDLPDYERFGLVIQLSKASVSIPSNIAEGSAKSSDKDLKRYLEFSLGSSYELEKQLILADELYSVDTALIIQKFHEEQKMLSSFINKL